MKAPKRNKPATIRRVTAYVTMSNGKQFVFLDMDMDTLTVFGQLEGKYNDATDANPKVVRTKNVRPVKRKT